MKTAGSDAMAPYGGRAGVADHLGVCAGADVRRTLTPELRVAAARSACCWSIWAAGETAWA